MKIRIFSVILAALMLCGLVSCSEAAADAEFVEINENKVVSVTFTEDAGAAFDMRELVAAYNEAELVGAAEEDYKSKAGNKVIVLTYTDDKTAFTLFYMGGDEFCVGGTDVEVPFTVKSKKLAELYKEALDPTPVFTNIDIALVEDAVLIKYPDAEVDSAAVVEAYNEAKLISNAKGVKSTDDIIVITTGESAFSITDIGDGRFMVSGSDITVDYIIESDSLAEIFEQYKK